MFSNYRNIEYRLGEIKKLADQDLNLSDIGLGKDHRLPTSDKYSTNGYPDPEGPTATINGSGTGVIF
jgi:hypothetical protein